MSGASISSQGGEPESLVFPSSRGTRLSADALQRLVAKHAEAAATYCPSLLGRRIRLIRFATRRPWTFFDAA